MKKLFSTLTLAVCLCGFISCSDDEQEMSINKNKSVDSKSEIELINGGTMLRFKDMATYESSLLKISGMTSQERFNYLDSLSFRAQVVIMQEADDELDRICEQAADKAEFDVLYKKYKQKYNKMFMFNELDPSDLSPYSKLVFAVDEHFVNEDGQFMIGDSLVNSKKYLNYQERQQSFVVNTRAISDLSSVNDAYSRQSDRKVGMQLSVGNENMTSWIHATFTAQKKGIFGWSRYSTVYYGNVHIYGANFEFAQGQALGYGPAFVNKDGVPFSFQTAEKSGNFTTIFGRKAYGSRAQGTMEIWSRGISYDDRGFSSINLL